MSPPTPRLRRALLDLTAVLAALLYLMIFGHVLEGIDDLFPAQAGSLILDWTSCLVTKHRGDHDGPTHGVGDGDGADGTRLHLALISGMTAAHGDEGWTGSDD